MFISDIVTFLQKPLKPLFHQYSSMDTGQSSAQNETENEDKLDQFLKKGADILETFTSSIEAFQNQTMEIKQLQQTVIGLKRKFEGNDDEEGKRIRNDADRDDSSEDEVALMMDDSETKSEDYITDLDDFFKHEQVVGEKIQERVANVVNKSLRGTTDNVKIKQVKDKYKRPENVENLQIPKVDQLLWNQLQTSTKAKDAVKQRMVGQLNAGITPLVVAMDHISGNKEPKIEILKECIGDTFKIMCSEINKLNEERREAIKKEIFPHLKTICSSEHPASATKLFGDGLMDQLKNLESGKNIKLTARGAQQSFLGRRGGLKPSYQTLGQQSQSPSYKTRMGLSRHMNYRQRYKNYGKKLPNQAGLRGKGPLKTKRY